MSDSGSAVATMHYRNRFPPTEKKNDLPVHIWLVGIVADTPASEFSLQRSCCHVCIGTYACMLAVSSNVDTAVHARWTKL
jgi:hypothetical protein